MIAIMLVPSDRYSTLLVVSLHAYKYDHASGRVNCTIAPRFLHEIYYPWRDYRIGGIFREP